IDFLSDPKALEAAANRAREVARSMDIGFAVNRVQHLCEELLDLPLTDFEAEADQGEVVASRRTEDPESEDDDDRDGFDDEIDEDSDSDGQSDSDSDGDSDSDSDDSEELDDDNEDDEDSDNEDEDDDGEADDDRDEERSSDDSSADAAPEDDDGGSLRRRRRRRGRHRLRHDEEGGERPAGGDEAVNPKTPPKPPAPTEDEIIDEAGERLRELDPRLTLRDLLPFLRPPKHVYVMSLASGTGQHRAGEAIFEAFRAIDQNLKVKQFNIVDLLDRHVTQEDLEAALEVEQRRVPATPVDETGEVGDQEGEKPPTASKPLEGLFGSKLANLILEKRPHQIVVTHYLPLEALGVLKRENELAMRICVVVTDYDFHAAWVAEGVDQYLVPNDKVRFKMIRAGVPGNIIDVVGLPVHPRFEGEVDRDRIRRDLGVRGNSPMLLLRPGGMGDNAAILDLVGSITSVGHPLNLMVLAGKNELLLEELNKLKTPKGVMIKGHGFVPNIHEMMGVADLMITRAVGHTVAEAFASGLPMVLFRPQGAVEERAADWFVERGVAFKARDGLDLEWLVSDLLRNNGRGLRQMREASRGTGRPRRGAASLSVEKICRELH
ncbi:MAG: hypothetical protein KDB53_09035, partial [Planctomycetes bacterium]|nr:hypothetical protein [Planctomycetota bacterium]